MRLSERGKGNLLRLMAMAREDPVYRQMMGEFQSLDSRVQEVMEAMSVPDQEIVGSYLAVVAQAGRHMVDMACEAMEFPEK